MTQKLYGSIEYMVICKGSTYTGLYKQMSTAADSGMKVSLNVAKSQYERLHPINLASAWIIWKNNIKG